MPRTAATRFEPALTLAMASGWLEAGVPDEARAGLGGAERAAARSLALTVGGRQVAWFDKDADAVAWLTRLIGPQRTDRGGRRGDRWLMFRGDAARNVAAAGGAPLFSLCWRIPRPSTDLERPSAADETHAPVAAILPGAGAT